MTWKMFKNTISEEMTDLDISGDSKHTGQTEFIFSMQRAHKTLLKSLHGTINQHLLEKDLP